MNTKIIRVCIALELIGCLVCVFVMYLNMERTVAHDHRLSVPGIWAIVSLGGLAYIVKAFLDKELKGLQVIAHLMFGAILIAISVVEIFFVH